MPGLLEQQHVGRLVGIALGVVEAALGRQQQYCIACFVTRECFSWKVGWQLMYSCRQKSAYSNGAASAEILE